LGDLFLVARERWGRPRAKAPFLVEVIQGAEAPAHPVEQATARATANAGVLRSAQDDGEKQTTASTRVESYGRNNNNS
jgi:hypothetical protein